MKPCQMKPCQQKQEALAKGESPSPRSPGKRSPGKRSPGKRSPGKRSLGGTKMKDVHCIIIQFITQCGYWDPERIMNKERAVYMQTLKRKCSLAKNPSKQDVQAYSACAANHYNGSRLKPMDDKQIKCLKRNCDHLIQGGKKRSAKKRNAGLRERFGKP